MLDRNDFDLKLKEVRGFIQNDGGDIVMKTLDAEAGAVSLRLEIGEGGCHDCIVEPDILRQIVREMLAGVSGITAVEIEDPRIY